jgi:hypothetical protein
MIRTALICTLQHIKICSFFEEDNGHFSIETGLRNEWQACFYPEMAIVFFKIKIRFSLY